MFFKCQPNLRWIHWLLIATLVAVSMLVAGLPIFADDDDPREYEANQIVVKLNPTMGSTIEPINAAYGTSTLSTILASRGIYLLQVPPNSGGDDDDDDDDDPVEELVDQMDDDPRLIYVEPNYIVSPPENGGRNRIAWGGADANPYTEQYAADLLRFSEAHAISRGSGSIVAILDTGFQLDHPALADNLTAARYDFVDDDSEPTEDFANLDADGDGIVDDIAGHGTHVATTVLLAAPDAQIMPVRVLDGAGRGNVFLIAEAVNFAAANGAHVINLSLGTTAESEILGDVIGEAIAAGMVVVAAAGNLASSTPMYPAAEENVIAVGAVTQNKARAAFSNYGDWLTVAAPGEGIAAGFPLNGYANWSGTSMATPFVAGQAALIRAVQPTWDGDNISRRIQTTAEPLGSDLGAGLIDLLASLQSDTNPTPTSAPSCECDDATNAAGIRGDCDDNDDECDDDAGGDDGSCDDDDCDDDGDQDDDGYQDDGFCDDDDDDGTDDACEEWEIDVDTDDGALLTTNDGSIEIRFPANSVTTNTRFRWTETQLNSEAAAIAPGPFGRRTFLLKALNGTEIDDEFVFREPIRITIHYTAADLGTIDEDTLLLYFRDTTQNRWRPASDSCDDDVEELVVRDKTNQKLTIAVCHLTQFGLFGESATSIYLPFVRR